MTASSECEDKKQGKEASGEPQAKVAKLGDTSRTYVLFCGMSLLDFESCSEQETLRQDAFGNAKAVVLKHSQKDAVKAMYRVHMTKPLSHALEYAICEVVIPEKTWLRLESLGVIQETWWLDLPGYRFSADLSDVLVTLLSTETWEGR